MSRPRPRWGLRLEWVAAQDPPWLGAESRAGAHGELVLGTVYRDGAAEQAGLAPRDVVLALDGLRVDMDGLEACLRRYRAGDTLRVHAMRRDELFETRLCLQEPPVTRARLRLDEKADDASAEARGRRWMGDAHGAAGRA